MILFKKKQKEKGFSLLGIIILFFIIVVGLVGILSLVNSSLRASRAASMRLVAANLAQEGVEMVRYFRKIDPAGWNNWHNSVINDDYRVQYNPQDPHNQDSLLGFSETPLKIDNSGYYRYDAVNDSPYYRKITLKKESSNETKVRVEMKWKVGNNWTYLIVEDRLWRWK